MAVRIVRACERGAGAPEAAYLHCAKAFMRSRLWAPDAQVERSALPTIGQMIGEQTGLHSPVESREDMERRYAPDLCWPAERDARPLADGGTRSGCSAFRVGRACCPADPASASISNTQITRRLDATGPFSGLFAPRSALGRYSRH